MGKKILFIHVGFPKTGTSAIQTLLKKNRNILLKEKILYPETGITGYSGHANLFFSLKEKKRNIPYLKTVFEKLEKEIQNSNCNKIILSSEYFFALEKDEIVRLRENFRDYKVKIIVYFRRVDERVESGYVQVVKDSEQRFHGNIGDYIRFLKKHPQRIDYKLFCNVWSDIFGKENIIVRVYEKEQLSKGIYHDFINILDLNLNDTWNIPKNYINERLGKTAFKFLLKCNEYPMSKNDHNKLVKALMSLDINPDVYENEKNYSILNEDERKNLIEQYELSCEYVAKEFLNRKNGKLFVDKADELIPTGIDTKLKVNEAISIFVDIFQQRKKLPNISIYKLARKFGKHSIMNYIFKS